MEIKILSGQASLASAADRQGEKDGHAPATCEGARSWAEPYRARAKSIDAKKNPGGRSLVFSKFSLDQLVAGASGQLLSPCPFRPDRDPLTRSTAHGRVVAVTEARPSTPEYLLAGCSADPARRRLFHLCHVADRADRLAVARADRRSTQRHQLPRRGAAPLGLRKRCHILVLIRLAGPYCEHASCGDVRPSLPVSRTVTHLFISGPSGPPGTARVNTPNLLNPASPACVRRRCAEPSPRLRLHRAPGRPSLIL